MRKKWTSLCLVLVMLCGMTGCIKKEEKKEVELHILAAASMTDVLTEISEAYEKEHEHVKFVFKMCIRDSNNTEGNGNLALDNNLNTMWHTNWNGCQRSETWITIDMKKEQNVAMLKYTPRQGGGTNGNITAYEIYVSRCV